MSLRESELKFNALFNSASEAIIVSDERGEIILSSKRAQELFGYSEDEMQRLSIDSLVPERFSKNHSTLRNQYNQAPKTRIMGQGMELHARKKDGSEFPVEISLSFVKKKDGILITSFVLDITRRKLAEEALVKANQELENFALQLKRSNVDLEQFAYVASHDLQEPLRKIQAFGGLILSEESATLSQEGKDYFNRIQNAAGRMQKLINDLLSFSRITSAPEPFTKVDLNQTLKDVLIDLEISINKTNAVIESEVLPEIEASPLQMRQLFQNLLTNSIKFKKDTLAPIIQIKVHSNEILSKNSIRPIIELSFSDNGKGFEEKYAEKIFNLFQRLENTHAEGSGIGLAVCKKIVTRHSGTIIAKGEPGKGAEFIIELPVRQ
ncbi:MAG: hypothetical protein A3H98_12960 [Bacteroidetes bacterium RIFCSPLOWO2_02_FULL_36_8]|nr:MAG: hypothetical protein A3H98_12960 [Bacteroidetes bacterium RIFCSPLOWO2_02_FULL_36_8]OFY69703.1 MAG: hypothetical protein A3G23_13910 [Bacteroidetes bacterium RIFCSPLOWO2_12_FULL_37_12]